MQKTNPASQRALLICDFLDLLGAAQALLLDELENVSYTAMDYLKDG